MERSPRTILIAIAVLTICCVAGFAVYALTAANTITATRAGTGSGTVTPYTATNIDYSLNVITPFNIDAVIFTLSPAAAGSVRAVFNGSTYACSNASGTVSCATTSPQATVLATNTLQVIAAT